MTHLKRNPYVIFPIQHQELWKSYKDAVATFWTAEEIDLSKDMNDWNSKLNDNEKFFITHILAFFAGSDGIVMENLAERFMNDVDIPEAKHFYAYQMFNEAIHSETYSLLIDTYITDKEQKAICFDAINKIPCIKQKAEWALKWINSEQPYTIRALAFAAVEGIHFSGSFAAIYWLKSRGLMPGLAFSNELISRDEGKHTDFAILISKIYSEREGKPKQEVIHQIYKEAVGIEKEFITKSIPCNMIGMNIELMCQYIEFVADRLLKQAGYEPMWNSQNPFDFMELISLRPKSNFFEVRVGEYKKSGVGQSKEDNTFEIEEDF
jgi:ribonucleotide reductase beta subunit family protein with ferritin-like domain